MVLAGKAGPVAKAPPVPTQSTTIPPLADKADKAVQEGKAAQAAKVSAADTVAKGAKAVTPAPVVKAGKEA